LLLTADTNLLSMCFECENLLKTLILVEHFGYVCV